MPIESYERESRDATVGDVRSAVHSGTSTYTT